jgi:hypothetical protein
MNQDNNENENENQNVNDLSCFVCRNNLPANKPRRCSRCSSVYYCSKTCQKIHWKGGHRHSCSAGGINLGTDDLITNPFFYHRYFGFCLDCVDEGNRDGLWNISHFCDSCERALICRNHEVTHAICQKCRE